MANKYTFERTEYKYMLTPSQYEGLTDWLAGYAAVDSYGKTTINNIYYDTPDYRLIRKSLEKPVYKEKLRLRSYGTAADSKPSFIELKKKYMGVVYKRRMELCYNDAQLYLNNGIKRFEASQISNEIDYFLQKNEGIAPRMAISYDRIAMAGLKDPELRLTFDENIRWSASDLDLKTANTGRQILKSGSFLLEIKIPNAMPLELSEALSELGIFKTSFSKYGRAYEMMGSMERQGAAVPVPRPVLEPVALAGYAFAS